MSRLSGEPGDRWPLSRAVDAMGESARRAGVPGFVWVAGAFYPSLQLSGDVVVLFTGLVERTMRVDVPWIVGSLTPALPARVTATGIGPLVWPLAFLALLPLFLVLYRLVAGLARVSDPTRFERARGARRTVLLRDAWRAGKGLAASALGLWVLIKLLLLGALIVLVGPVIVVVLLTGIEGLSALLMGLFVPVLLVLLLYGIVLEVMNQLALHSLAHNRRGVASALSHAWRLVRNDPLAALRATLVDLLLAAVIVIAGGVVPRVGEALGWIGETVAMIVAIALLCFVGVARAGYWSRTYRGLGGLSADDVVPGLGDSTP